MANEFGRCQNVSCASTIGQRLNMPAEGSIFVLLAPVSPLIAGGVEKALEDDPGIQLLTGSQPIGDGEATSPDVIVVDEYHDMAQAVLSREATGPPMLVVAAQPTPMLLGFLRLYGIAWIPVSCTRDEIRAGVRQVVGRPSPAQPDGLTDREVDVLRLIEAEQTYPEIARELHVSLQTAREHGRNIRKKLGVRSKHQLVVRQGLQSLPTYGRKDQPPQKPPQGGVDSALSSD